MKDVGFEATQQEEHHMDVGPEDAIAPLDVWLTFFDEIHDEALLASFASLLSEDEARRNAAFHFAGDRKCHLVTRALVRTVLSRYAAVQPGDWTFSTNAYGKPCISNRASDAQQLSFNVSHTRGLIALAVAGGESIGIDVEHTTGQKGVAALAPDVLSPEELSAFEQLPSDVQERAFLQRWTLKEAYVKARGAGLSIPLSQFSVGHVMPCRRSMRAAPGIDAAGKGWAFWQYEISPSHLLSLCLAHSARQVPNVRFRRVVPLHSEAPMRPDPLGCLEHHAT